jgi:hypothetical protein
MMCAFRGDLLIGGGTLKQVQGELEDETPQPNSQEWQLTGHLRLPTAQSALLQVHRTYRLELSDGRAGQVIVSRIAPANDALQVVDFHAPQRPRVRRPR